MAMKMAGSKNALKFLSLISFLEGMFLPLPPDFILIPIAVNDRRKAFTAAHLTFIFNIMGAVIAYIIGLFFFESVGEWILEKTGHMESFGMVGEYFRSYGQMIVLAGALTPLPFNIISIASGLFRLNFVVFLVTAMLARAFRFYLEGFLLYRYGEKAKMFIEKHLGKVTFAAFLVILVIFLFYRYYQ
jgi:membrane protein YqaA with SNARE-associated domain